MDLTEINKLLIFLIKMQTKSNYSFGKINVLTVIQMIACRMRVVVSLLIIKTGNI